MSVTHARACLKNVELHQFDPLLEQKALAALSRWAIRFSPLSGIDAAFKIDDTDQINQQLHCGINLDISGSVRLFRGEENLVNQLNLTLKRFGLTGRLAVAPTLGAAWAFSRFARVPTSFIPQDKLHQQLAELPVRALRIDNLSRQILTEVGISNLRELLELPPKALLDRFGPRLLIRIRQLIGHEDEPITPIRITAHPELFFPLTGPTTQLEALYQITKELLKRLCQELEKQHQRFRKLLFIYRRINAPTATLSLILSSPSADPQHLWSLLQPRLEKLNLADGVDLVSVRILDKTPAQTLAVNFLTGISDNSGNNKNESQLALLLDQLINNLGADKICHFELLSSHLPERSYRFASSSKATPLKQKKGESFYRTKLFIRPSVILESPLPIRTVALLPDKPPSRIQWRNRSFRVICGIGPERIGSEWWQAQPQRAAEELRDYFRIQLQTGTWIWIFRRVNSTQWFIHGVWA